MRLLVTGLAGLVLWFGVTTTVFAASSYFSGTYGNDISYPQCGSSSLPTNTFGIVGVSGGRAFTTNSCLASEFGWASHLLTAASLYMNLNSPIGSTASNGNTGPYGTCAKTISSVKQKITAIMPPRLPTIMPSSNTQAPHSGGWILRSATAGHPVRPSTRARSMAQYAFSLRILSLLASTPQKACGRVLPAGTSIS